VTKSQKASQSPTATARLERFSGFPWSRRTRLWQVCLGEPAQKPLWSLAQKLLWSLAQKPLWSLAQKPLWSAAPCPVLTSNCAICVIWKESGRKSCSLFRGCVVTSCPDARGAEPGDVNGSRNSCASRGIKMGSALQRKIAMVSATERS